MVLNFEYLKRTGDEEICMDYGKLICTRQCHMVTMWTCGQGTSTVSGGDHVYLATGPIPELGLVPFLCGIFYQFL